MAADGCFEGFSCLAVCSWACNHTEAASSHIVLSLRSVDVLDDGFSFQGEEELCAGGLRMCLRVQEPQVRERHGSREDFAPT